MKAIKVSQAKVHQPKKKVKKKVDFKYILLAIFLVGLLISRTDNIYAWIAFVAFAAFVGNNDTQSDEDWRDNLGYRLRHDPKFSSLSGNLFHND